MHQVIAAIETKRGDDEGLAAAWLGLESNIDQDADSRHECETLVCVIKGDVRSGGSTGKLLIVALSGLGQPF